MCDTCGCGKAEGFTINGPEYVHDHEHYHENGVIHSHSHDHDHGNEHSHDHKHYNEKKIDMNVDILSGNNITAGMNRRFFEGRKLLCLNIVSSPGSGKTTLLEKSICHLSPSRKIYVIEGDQQTVIDAERIRKAGAPALQINTGSGCHLDALMIEEALKKLDIEPDSILFIENVGNLVCPAMFDLGEYKRVLVVSVTEGEDKPLKYPHMFETSHLCIINKSDLLPYVDFSKEKFIENASLINHHLEFITVSVKSGEGMGEWHEWISTQTKSFISR